MAAYETSVLNVHQFTSIEDARKKIEAWRIDYNQRRPHSSNEYAQQCQNDPKKPLFSSVGCLLSEPRSSGDYLELLVVDDEGNEVRRPETS